MALSGSCRSRSDQSLPIAGSAARTAQQLSVGVAGIAMSLLRAGCALFRRQYAFPTPMPVRHLATRSSRERGQRNDNAPPLNEQLRRLREVRLVSASGTDEGLMSGASALARARDAGLDLMQVRAGGPTSATNPPVVRLLDYPAFEEAQRRKRYEASKKKKTGENAGMVKLKQVRLSPSTGPHDLGIKLKQAKGFLTDGHRVRIYMQFRRGQGRLKEDAKKALVDVAQELAPLGNLRGVASAEDVLDLFQEPPADPNAPADAPIKQKPLEIVFEPLSKKLREKAKQELLAENG